MSKIKKNDKAIASVNDNRQEAPDFQLIPALTIEISPLNYRKYIDEEALNAFSEEIKLHGIISPITVRTTENGNYQLVAGERRLRAGWLAGLQYIPAIVKQFSDEEVIEIQLAENIQRENPHPMDEAGAIGQMLNMHKTIDEIGLRLGRSKQFVYSRIKLLSLVPDFQEMFLANMLTLQHAIELAGLEAQSQDEVFQNCCTRWKQDKKIRRDQLEYYMEQCKYDLKKAPFNIKDKKLVPEAGACTNCSYNTATLKTLFPEYAKQAVCNNKNCYQKKCMAHVVLGITNAFLEHQPEALLFYGEPSELLEDILKTIPTAENLPRYEYHQVQGIDVPESPDPQYYTDEEGELDSEEFQIALKEYESELEEYNNNMQSGKYKKGLLVTIKSFQVYLFTLEKSMTNGRRVSTVTAKQVQEAIKAGTATPELLQAEISRIEERDKRALEIDREKIQLTLHHDFRELLNKGFHEIQCTSADQLAARLIIYQALDYSGRNIVQEVLFPEADTDANVEVETPEHELLVQLVGLTDQQFSYLIRMVIAGKSESKYVWHDSAKCLYQLAESAGINIDAIEYQFEQKAAERQNKKQERINVLEKKMASLVTTK